MNDALSPASTAPAASPHGGVVDAARAGDRAAFASLFASHAAMVHGVALARVGPADADDVVQETFIVALERIEGLRDAGAFGPWLAQIARNLATDVGRRRARRRTEPLEPEADIAAPGADGEARAEAERVLQALRALPEAYRETLVLRLVEGLSGPEIARQVGMTDDSVRVNLHRGMKLLKEALAWER
ncbi:MAG: sigma-70 family RNA polymerase sigma factor [Myxococcales bacterium]|jgi:RNA polymerase sigma-70 factor (ECF subfamily)|nr:sigma-70 family RNA polymerase sigma factor [Myxococcales bacterium]